MAPQVIWFQFVNNTKDIIDNVTIDMDRILATKCLIGIDAIKTIISDKLWEHLEFYFDCEIDLWFPNKRRVTSISDLSEYKCFKDGPLLVKATMQKTLNAFRGPRAPVTGNLKRILVTFSLPCHSGDVDSAWDGGAVVDIYLPNRTNHKNLLRRRPASQ